MKKLLFVLLVAVLATTAVFASQFSAKANIGLETSGKSPINFTLGGSYYFENGIKATAKAETFSHEDGMFFGLYVAGGYDYVLSDIVKLSGDAGVGFCTVGSKTSFSVMGDLEVSYAINETLTVNAGVEIKTVDSSSSAKPYAGVEYKF